MTVLLTIGCQQKKHDVAYYEHMVDSIRKAEQVKEMQRKAGMTDDDPLEAFFLTVHRRSLPLQSEGGNWRRLGDFTNVPRSLNDCFGYMSEAELSVMSMPKAGKHPMLMLLEMQDSITPVLYLCTMDDKHRMIDQLCIYEERSVDRSTDFGKTTMDYFVTSQWEVTLMKYYQSHEATRPVLEQTRRYIINKEGKFEEVIIEL